MATLKTLTLEEIGEVLGYFAAAAVRCKATGFDFIEIDAGHGDPISAFLRPNFNLGTDRYGGSLENPARFLIEIIRPVRAEVGAAIGVGVKTNGKDYLT